jgi:CTP:molybdopterin cytidylyltransferase MocA
LAIGQALLREVPGLDLGAGLRQLLERHPREVAEVAVDDPGCLRDVDTPEDYRALTGRSPGGG